MTLQSGFFPSFENEYFAPFEAWIVTGFHDKNCGVEDEMLLLDNSNFRSLLLAAYEFEMAVKERWIDLYGSCDGMIIEMNFMVPAEIDGTACGCL